MKKVCVIFGGASVEHDISIITGMQLAKNLKGKMDVEKIYLGLDNKFYLATKINDLSLFENKQSLKLKELIFAGSKLYVKGMFLKKYCDIDCVINCCHGGIGEKGELAGFFAVNNVNFTSANSLAAYIAMDKNLAKELVEKYVPTIKGVKVTKDNFEKCVDLIKKNYSNNLIVKPNSLGSSIGVKSCTKENFELQIMAIFEMNDDALVEERVVDLIEYNQACFIDNGELVLSSIEQPLTKSDFLTFEDKYKTPSKGKGRDRIIPAKISKTLEKKINNYTKQIYTTLNMNGVVRIDYIFDKANNKIYFNEVNTIPGSMSFYLYEPKGIDYITLIEKLIKNAKNTQKFAYFDTKILKNKKI